MAVYELDVAGPRCDRPAVRGRGRGPAAWAGACGVGGGLRRGRRDADAIRVGEALDFWRVEAIESGRLLRLRAEVTTVFGFMMMER